METDYCHRVYSQTFNYFLCSLLKAILVQELAVHTFRPSTWEEEVEKSEGHPQLCSKIQASLGYMRLYQNNSSWG